MVSMGLILPPGPSASHRCGLLQNVRCLMLGQFSRIFEKRPQLSQAGAVNFTSGRNWRLKPGGSLSVPAVCEALRTREGRNSGAGLGSPCAIWSVARRRATSSVRRRIATTHSRRVRRVIGRFFGDGLTGHG